MSCFLYTSLHGSNDTLIVSPYNYMPDLFYINILMSSIRDINMLMPSILDINILMPSVSYTNIYLLKHINTGWPITQGVMQGIRYTIMQVHYYVIYLWHLLYTNILITTVLHSSTSILVATVLHSSTSILVATVLRASTLYTYGNRSILIATVLCTCILMSIVSHFNILMPTDGYTSVLYTVCTGTKTFPHSVH